MKEGIVQKIDYSRKRLAALADNFYNEGKYLSALRFAYKELDIYGGDAEVYARLTDIYEGMGLQGTAVNWWFRFLHVADEEDLPEIYEGLAVNFLNMGNESQSAYYYNKLIDVDDSLPEETKMDIAAAFSTAKKDSIHFVYPPRLADYTKEMHVGSRSLKMGDCERAVDELSKIEKGAKDYPQAQEMIAVAHLLTGNSKAAEDVCVALLQDYPDDIRAQATLAAVYLEQGRAEESKALALRLAAQKQTEADDLYKVATVCCENGLHEEAYGKFCLLDEKIPFDGRMLYFKGVAAYKSGRIAEAEKAFATLCTVYPDAEVAKYYLQEIRAYQDGERETAPELIYFYHLPQDERENRCKTLLQMSKCPKDEALLFSALALKDGYFRWCFDEMDGGDHDLQYLAIIAAVHVYADDFLQDILLDSDVADVLKIEMLRMLYERNEDMEMGIVLYNIYRKLYLQSIRIGRKKRKRFLQAYAKVASKFVGFSKEHGTKLKNAAEKLYRSLEYYNALDLIDKPEDCACAIFLISELKELGTNSQHIASTFDANEARVSVLLTMVLSKEMGLDVDGIETMGENANGEID